MNFRNTAMLFGLSLGMLWLFGLMLAYKKIPLDESLVLKTLRADPDAVIDALIIKRGVKGASELQFVKKDSDWFLQAGSHSIRMDDNQINKIIREVKDATKIEGSDITLDPEKNGLGNPQVVVTLKGHSGAKKEKTKEDETEKARGKEREWQLRVGNTGADKTRVFVSSSDRPGQVLVVSRSAIDSLFFKDDAALRPTQLFAFNELNIKKVLLKEGKTELELKKNEDETWRFVVPPMGFADFEGPQPAKDLSPFPPKKEQPATGGVKGLIAKIRGLKVESENDFVPAAGDINLGNYGLDAGKESLRIQMSAADEKKSEVLLVGSKVPDRDQYFFAHMQGDLGVFMLSGKQLASLKEILTKRGELRSLSITFVDAKKVDMLKLTLGKEQQIVLTHPDEKLWEMRVGDSKSESKVNDAAVKAMLDAVEGKRDIQKFYDADGDAAKKLDAELGFDAPSAELALFTDSQPKKTKDDKKEEKKEEKKETKPAVTLIFGKGDKESVPVKRVQPDGTVSRFALAKSVADKIVPPEGRLAFLDTGLPANAYEDVAALIIERGSEKLEFVRGQGLRAGRWVFKQQGTEQNLADNEKVDAYIHTFARLQVGKWLHKIDDKKDDLAPYGLNAPLATVTLVLKKTSHTAAAGIAGLALSPLGITSFDTTLSAIGMREAAKAETVVFRLGKETDVEKDKPGSFALAGNSDMLFLVPTEFVKRLKSDDFRDRTMIVHMQSILNAAALSAGPGTILAETPILSRVVNSLEPTKIKELRVEVHQYELRKFQFVRQTKAAEKTKEAAKTWQDQSGLVDFTLDSEKVNNLVEAFAKLQAERIVTLVDGPKADFKLDPKEAILKIDATLESGQVTILVGSRFVPYGYYAQSSAWPGAVFLLSSEFVNPYLRGAASFGKDRIAAE